MWLTVVNYIIYIMSGFGYSEPSVRVLGFRPDEGSINNKIIATLTSDLARRFFSVERLRVPEGL